MHLPRQDEPIRVEQLGVGDVAEAAEHFVSGLHWLHLGSQRETIDIIDMRGTENVTLVDFQRFRQNTPGLRVKASGGEVRISANCFSCEKIKVQ